jgi:hypothetical protein
MDHSGGPRWPRGGLLPAGHLLARVGVHCCVVRRLPSNGGIHHSLLARHRLGLGLTRGWAMHVCRCATSILHHLLNRLLLHCLWLPLCSLARRRALHIDLLLLRWGRQLPLLYRLLLHVGRGWL